MSLVDAAMQLAIASHGGDRNKHDGEMYTLHLARVWINTRDAGGGDVRQAIAWLHDSIEDTPLGILDIRSGLYAIDPSCDPVEVERVEQGVRAMTKIKGESNEEYYHRVKENRDARFVKLHGDLVDNFRRNHQIKDEDTRLRMAAKYSLGMDILSP